MSGPLRVGGQTWASADSRWTLGSCRPRGESAPICGCQAEGHGMGRAALPGVRRRLQQGPVPTWEATLRPGGGGPQESWADQPGLRPAEGGEVGRAQGRGGRERGGAWRGLTESPAGPPGLARHAGQAALSATAGHLHYHALVPEAQGARSPGRAAAAVPGGEAAPALRPGPRLAAAPRGAAAVPGHLPGAVLQVRAPATAPSSVPVRPATCTQPSAPHKPHS